MGYGEHGIATRMMAPIEQKIQASPVARFLFLPSSINNLRASARIFSQSAALQDFVGRVRWRVLPDIFDSVATPALASSA